MISNLECLVILKDPISCKKIKFTCQQDKTSMRKMLEFYKLCTSIYSIHDKGTSVVQIFKAKVA